MSDTEMQTCFCLEELTESKVNLKRLTAALNEQYPIYLSYKGTGSDSEYSAIAALHITATDLWSEFPKILHSLAEYDDEQLYATALKLSDAVKRFDFLKRGNYSALISALSSFADMLPDGKCIDAKAAAHLMNRIKMGYFPTDLEHVKLIKKAVRFPKGQVNILDPCCGEGLALKAFSEGENAVTYGIEIDEERGRRARENLDRAVLGSFFYSRYPFGRFHAIFLNPPYLSCPGPDGRRRMERAFLADTLPLLMKGGLLVYIIPSHRATESVCSFLAGYFKNISLYRFRDSEYKKYKQVVFFGIRADKHDGGKTAKKIEELSLNPEKIPLIDTIPEGLYSLPEKESEVPYFRGSVFDTEELAEQLKSSDSLQVLFDGKSLENRVRKPLLPLNLSQIGLVGASGLMNGLVDCEHPHVIKGKIVRQKKTSETVNRERDCSELREVESNKMVFNILTPDSYISVS